MACNLLDQSKYPCIILPNTTTHPPAHYLPPAAGVVLSVEISGGWRILISLIRYHCLALANQTMILDHQIVGCCVCVQSALTYRWPSLSPPAASVDPSARIECGEFGARGSVFAAEEDSASPAAAINAVSTAPFASPAQPPPSPPSTRSTDDDTATSPQCQM